jgi:hypothetical protein
MIGNGGGAGGWRSFGFLMMVGVVIFVAVSGAVRTNRLAHGVAPTVRPADYWMSGTRGVSGTSAR